MHVPPWELKYLRACAEIQLRGLKIQHRQAARLCGWSAPSASTQAMTSLVDKHLMEAHHEVLVKHGKNRVWVDAGPRLTDKAWEYLKRAA